MNIVWKRLPDTQETKVSWRTVVTKHFEMPNGATEEYGTLHPEGTKFVALIGLTPDKKVVIARQFRPGPECIMHEIPGGAMEPQDVDPQAAAVREFEEETGYSPARIEAFEPLHLDAYSNAASYYFIGYDCTPTATRRNPDPHEFIEVAEIPISELIANAKSDRMTDVPAVLLAYDTLSEIQNGK